MLVCKVCSLSASIIAQLPNKIRIGQCMHCRLVFVANRFSDRQLRELYTALDTDRYYAEIATGTLAKCQRAIEDIKELPISSVLDVGCGDGQFLELIRRHRSDVVVEGAEFTPSLVAKARAKGFQVYQETLNELAKEGKSYSLVTLLDVAEHVQDPVEFFSECAQIVSAGGHIYIHTPRRSAWDDTFIAVRSSTWLRSRVSCYHLQLWSDEALTSALNEAGFEIVAFHKELELSWPIENYFQTILHLPAWAAKILKWVTILPLRTMRNKAIVLAKRV